jgi:hypothetical protein
MTSYASADDVATRLGRTLDPTAEVPRVDALIEDVSALVDSFCRRSFSDPIPGAVKAIVCAEVMRAINQTPGISQEHVGDVQIRYVTSPTALSSAAREALTRYRMRIYSMPVVGTSWPDPPPSPPITIVYL